MNPPSLAGRSCLNEHVVLQSNRHQPFVIVQTQVRNDDFSHHPTTKAVTTNFSRGQLPALPD